MSRLLKSLPLGLRILAWLACLAWPAVSLAADEAGWTPLFNGRDLSGWTTFLDPTKKVKPEQVWQVKDGVIICQGRPAGYLLSEGEYENYVLEFEWRWGGQGGNSGCFVHVVGESKIWPKGVEAQLMADHAGDFWLVDGFRLQIDPARKDPNSDRHWFRTKDGVEKPKGEWNHYRIVCDGDTVTLFVNDQEVNVGTQAELTKGRILFQSEGAEIHFRNIRVKPLEK